MKMLKRKYVFWCYALLGLLPAAMLTPVSAQEKQIKSEDGSEMVLVPAGEFLMGSGTRRDFESPPHVVELPAFYIDKKEVTNAQYARFLKATDHQPPPTWNGPNAPQGKEQHPITNISWFEAMQYAQWAGKRLPTEAEWEKAARGTDARRYPWGELDDLDKRNIPGPGVWSHQHELVETGLYPEGASPYGCLDMSGNAWEWTASWYKPYPHTTDRSIFYGKKYKVMRGGGGTGLYSISNTGLCYQRARLLPYGAHDFLGFRCVKDVDPAKAPYDPEQLLADAEKELEASLRKPRTLQYEVRYREMKNTGRVPVKVVGEQGQQGSVRTGFPLPEGLLKNASKLALADESGEFLPLQVTTTTHWPDGSARWVLLDFQGRAGQTYFVHWNGQAPDASEKLDIRETDDGVVVDTGTLSVKLDKEKLIRSIETADGENVGPLNVNMEVAEQNKKRRFHAMPAETLEIEESGPLHGTIRLVGFLADEQNKKTPYKYDLRLRATAGSSRLSLLATLIHYADRMRGVPDEPLGKLEPNFKVTDARISIDLPENLQQSIFGTETGAQTLKSTDNASLTQPDDVTYAIAQPGQENISGTRSPGYLAVQPTDGNWFVFGVRYFWQNHPKSLFIKDGTAGVRLWSGEKPFTWEGGLAKTHELILDFTSNKPDHYAMDPLRVSLTPAWSCGTKASGALLPRGKESLSLFPYWELWRETDMQDWVAGMPYGFRNFGDNYFGGPTKGKNAFRNLEYDVHFNFLMEYLQTGEVWYLQTAEANARHQADIDINDYSGLIYKHSPLHTTWRADMGHVFVRGLLLHYLMTGERRSLEMAEKAGDWIRKKVTEAFVPENDYELTNEIGNERKIGWSLYALTGLYEVTRKERFLKTAEQLCNRLIAGQSPTGKFDIVWDNRISFFNGIAMNGMLTVYKHNQDPELKEGILKVARRSFGMYPEYACRTLNAFSWALTETGDPRFLNAMERTWEASMDFMRRVWDCVVAETHSWKYPRFAAQYQLFPLFENQPDAIPDPESWAGIRLRDRKVQFFLRRTGDRPAPVMLIRGGLTTGTVKLLDSAGKLIEHFELKDNKRFFEAATFNLPEVGEVYRVLVDSPEAWEWQLHHDGGSDMIVYDSSWAQMHELRPKAYCFTKPGAEQIKLKLEAKGEGFYLAMLFDPQGRPVEAVRYFVDLGDPGRYVQELVAPIRGGEAGWSVQIYGFKVLEAEGILPYWSETADQLFNPEEVTAGAS